MRVALFSDVHGNLAALEAVLAKIDEGERVDVKVFAGDAVLFGPSPGEVVERLQASDIVCLRGNCDAIIAGRIEQQLPPDPAVREALRAHKEWTMARLSDAQIQWLAERPAQYRISPPDSDDPRRALVVTHATPRDVDDDVRFCSPDLTREEAKEVFGPADAGVVAFGHRHGHFINMYDDLTLVNVSSASMTPDGIAAAAYTIATWHGDHWSFEQHRIAYDIAAELERAQTRDLPFHPWWQYVSAQR